MGLFSLDNILSMSVLNLNFVHVGFSIYRTSNSCTVCYAISLASYRYVQQAEIGVGKDDNIDYYTSC